MSPGGFLAELVSDYTLRNVALGSVVLGVVSGALGSFAVLRRQSLLGDTVSHAALPGIAVVFLLTGSKAPLALLLGAALSGWIGALAILGITRSTRVKEDSAMGIVLSVFFGVGLMLLTIIQRLPTAAQAGLDRFLFGKAATLMAPDVTAMAALGGAALLVMALLWKELKILSFDPDYGAILGIRTRLVEAVLTTLIVIAVAVGLQTVGVVLMSAMVVSPAAAARQWTDRLGAMVALSALFGAAAGLSGAVLSSTNAILPTGPTIVVCLALLTVLSLMLAPRRGLLWRLVAARRNRRKFAVEGILRDLHALARQHSDPSHSHSIEALKTMRKRDEGVRQGLEALASKGLVVRTGELWALTPSGLELAESLAAPHAGASAERPAGPRAALRTGEEPTR